MILQKIADATRIRVDAAKKVLLLEDLETQIAENNDATRPFATSLKHENRLGLIAEIKKSSPSKGLIAPDFDHRKVAAIYRDSQADCLSVLTEPEFFEGQLSYLTDARQISGKPSLRKDFIIDEWQIFEARGAGADCILLIVAMLSDEEITRFKSTAQKLGMDALVEVHSVEEARRAAALGCEFVGINNRDLKTFHVDLATTEKIRPLLDDNAIIVGESGVFSGDDARRLRDAGVDALLVGESLMRSENPAASIAELLHV